MSSFLNRFTGKEQFLFRESKLFYHGIKNTPHPRWEVRQIMKIAFFSVKPLINLTCCNASVNSKHQHLPGLTPGEFF